MFGVMNQRGTVMVSKTAVVDVAELARRQFSERLERYRSLVAAAADHDGQLPAAQVEEFLAVASQLGIPTDRLGRDAGSLVASRNLEARVAEIRERWPTCRSWRRRWRSCRGSSCRRSGGCS